eukprot:SAG22_NODE_3634_length_1603_cov_2.456117_3_plen_250_part_01
MRPLSAEGSRFASWTTWHRRLGDDELRKSLRAEQAGRRAAAEAAAADLRTADMILAAPAGLAHLVSSKALPFCCASTVLLSKTAPFLAVPQQQVGRCFDFPPPRPKRPPAVGAHRLCLGSGLSRKAAGGGWQKLASWPAGAPPWPDALAAVAAVDTPPPPPGSQVAWPVLRLVPGPVGCGESPGTKTTAAPVLRWAAASSAGALRPNLVCRFAVRPSVPGGGGGGGPAGRPVKPPPGGLSRRGRPAGPGQ